MKGCGSHSCVIETPRGQGTNGPCSCNPAFLRATVNTLKAEVKGLREALEKLVKPAGAFSLDELTHAKNVIAETAEIARAALKGEHEGRE